MLIPLLILGGAIGSYAFFPSSWWKTKHRLTRKKRQKEGVLYLTFDDGPSPEDTPALLDLLARLQIPATFFVVGDFARAHPQIIRRMQDEGHLVGFHSAHHRSAYLMTPRQTRKDFAKGLEDLAHIGVKTRYFRPPWGVCNWSSFHQIKKHLLQPVLWDIMAQDWQNDITPEEIAFRLKQRTWPGAVICLHDGRGAPGAPARTIQALEIQLPQWLAQGFHFQTLEHYE